MTLPPFPMGKRRLEAGDRVLVYKDPITQLDPEGVAVLQNHISTIYDGEIWEVRFEDEPTHTVERHVKLVNRRGRE